jgi:hypothetical protein
MALGQANGKQPSPIGRHISGQQLGDLGTGLDGLNREVFQDLDGCRVPQLSVGLLRDSTAGSAGQQVLGTA